MTPEEALAHAQSIDPTAEEFVVRLWDGFDGKWMDIGEAGDAEFAKELWSHRTKKGTESTSYNDIDYYAIFPTTVTMRWSKEGLGSQYERKK